MPKYTEAIGYGMQALALSKAAANDRFDEDEQQNQEPV
jgi:hypothetical protein